MTTITSNGYYLIADKRQTHTRTVNQRNSSDGVRCRTVSSYSDHTVKIHTNLADQYTIYDETVVAYAITGDATAGDRFMSAAKGVSLEKFADIYTLLSDLRSSSNTFSIIMVTKSKKTFSIDIGIRVMNNTIVRSFDVEEYPPGYNIFYGSGSGLINRLANRGCISHKNHIANLHPLNIHLFNASTDKSSSCTYDVYGVDEDKLVIGLEPSIEAVQEAMDAVSSGIKFVAAVK